MSVIASDGNEWGPTSPPRLSARKVRRGMAGSEGVARKVEGGGVEEKKRETDEGMIKNGTLCGAGSGLSCGGSGAGIRPVECRQTLGGIDPPKTPGTIR